MWNFIAMGNVYRLLIDVMINLIVVSISFGLFLLWKTFESYGILDDGADEPFDCVNVTCPYEYFKCPSSGKCIPFERVCDNVDDCLISDRINGIIADETSQACSMNYFSFVSWKLTCFV